MTRSNTPSASEVLDPVGNDRVEDSAHQGAATSATRRLFPRRRNGSYAGNPARVAGGVGLITTYLSLIVVLPLAAVVWRSQSDGWGTFWKSVHSPQAWASLKLTIGAGVVVTLVNLVMGTLIAWVLVRDRFPGQGLVEMLVDLPFALPTIVAGLTLLTLYGATSPLHVDLAYARSGVIVALLFVTLPFVVRTVQPVLLELDRDMEDAAASLGAGQFTIFRRIILPNLLPAMLAGSGLAFARAISEFGSTVLISGNIPFKTEVAAVNIYNQIQSDNTTGAAAVSTTLLAVSLVVLVITHTIQRRVSRGE